MKRLLKFKHRQFFLLVSIWIVTGCQPQVKNEPEQNQHENPDTNLRYMAFVASGQISPAKKIKFNNCDFDLVFRVEPADDTAYLSTRDTNFVTEDGYRVGMYFSQLPDYLKNGVIREPGWGYYIKLDSGWSLGFCDGSACTDKELHDSSAIKWIFKRPHIY